MTPTDDTEPLTQGNPQNVSRRPEVDPVERGTERFLSSAASARYMLKTDEMLRDGAVMTWGSN